MSESGLEGRLAEIRATIARHQQGRGWAHAVRIVAVTKGHGPDAVRRAAAVGLDAVGENRVQEAIVKQEQCRDVPIVWHLIGAVQRNKVRQIIDRFELVHSVDRLDLAVEMQRRLAADRPQAVLVQVNCSREAQKGGVEPEALGQLLDALQTLDRIDVRGLMTMAELTDDVGRQREPFALLCRLRDEERARGHQLPELSMGMSGDYPIAVEEGATMVRLGTALFGARA
ncbi:MAG: YggS family pyridoxal phosphate-dependent enzyme [Gemmatimonadales bacterium]